MKTLLKRIKIAFKVLTSERKLFDFFVDAFDKNTRTLIAEKYYIREDGPHIFIGEDEDGNIVAYPQNITEEEFADIMSYEWEDM